MKKINRDIILFSLFFLLFTGLFVAGIVLLCINFEFVSTNQKILYFVGLFIFMLIAALFLIKLSSARYIKAIINSIEHGNKTPQRISKRIKSNNNSVDEYINKAIRRGYLDGYEYNDGVVYRNVNIGAFVCPNCSAEVHTLKNKNICPYCGNKLEKKLIKNKKSTD